jgi:hypothetical protein
MALSPPALPHDRSSDCFGKIGFFWRMASRLVKKFSAVK